MKALLLLAIVVAISEASLPSLRLSKLELQNFVNDIRRKDINKARSNQIRLNYQSHTRTSTHDDNARSKLFSSVDNSLLRKSTYQKFASLLDNYNPQTGEREIFSRREEQEVNNFLDEILRTTVMRHTYDLLHRKGHPYAATARVFRNYMYKLWFDGYSRARGVKDTSGFEHVMIGEIKNGQISGLHNWLQFYWLEKTGALDYMGYLVKRKDLMAAVKFQWNGVMKRSSSLLIGTSPEFDMALYTVCFLAHHRGNSDKCEVKIDNCEMSFVSHVSRQNGQDFIGSIYPHAGRCSR